MKIQMEKIKAEQLARKLHRLLDRYKTPGGEKAFEEAEAALNEVAGFDLTDEIEALVKEFAELHQAKAKAGARKAFAEAETKASQPPAQKPKKVKPRLARAAGQNWWDEWLRRLNEAIVRGNRAAIRDCVRARYNMEVPADINRLVLETIKRAYS